VTEQDVWSGWGSVIIASVMFGAFALVLAVLVWQGFRTWQTSLVSKAFTARETAFQRLVQEQMETQKQLERDQRELSQSLVTVRESLSSIERILKAVD
jgi:hypothetical protein